MLPGHGAAVNPEVSFLRRVESRLLKRQWRQVGQWVAGSGPTEARARHVCRNFTLAQVARLVAGSLQALGPAAPMAQTWNQYWVPLVRPGTVQLEAFPTQHCSPIPENRAL